MTSPSPRPGSANEQSRWRAANTTAAWDLFVACGAAVHDRFPERNPASANRRESAGPAAAAPAAASPPRAANRQVVSTLDELAIQQNALGAADEPHADVRARSSAP